MTNHHDDSIAKDAMLDFADSPEGFGIPASWRSLTGSQARLTLQKLTANAVFRDGASKRGNPNAEARLWLTAKIHGKDLSLGEVRHLAAGGDAADVEPDIVE